MEYLVLGAVFAVLFFFLARGVVRKNDSESRARYPQYLPPPVWSQVTIKLLKEIPPSPKYGEKVSIADIEKDIRDLRNLRVEEVQKEVK